ncbi:hypothetical protein OSB04_006455 [Centaurea solstitialis]|uniref:Uncharacterized protein n=1 Tax=Centaurea solstitialis TaxID=347529 RepID=A0AA38TUN3_9ASTR|nr:hypothetical protein OSB04_006455 [Centaurea solstitialis]
MFYFVKTENYLRRLVTNMISRMTALRFHMLCEFKGEMYVFEDQLGCEMMQVDNRAMMSLAPYMKGCCSSRGSGGGDCRKGQGEVKENGVEGVVPNTWRQ